MYCIRKSFSIDMAHILEDAYTKLCCNLHGHTYIVEVELQTPKLTGVNGMVLDYGYIKKVFNEKIKSEYDHGCMVPPKWHDKFEGIPGVVNVRFNPTAENIARYFFELLFEDLTKEDEYYLTAIIIKETDSSYAKYSIK